MSGRSPNTTTRTRPNRSLADDVARTDPCDGTRPRPGCVPCAPAWPPPPRVDDRSPLPPSCRTATPNVGRNWSAERVGHAAMTSERAASATRGLPRARPRLPVCGPRPLVTVRPDPPLPFSPRRLSSPVPQARLVVHTARAVPRTQALNDPLDYVIRRHRPNFRGLSEYPVLCRR